MESVGVRARRPVDEVEGDNSQHHQHAVLSIYSQQSGKAGSNRAITALCTLSRDSPSRLASQGVVGTLRLLFLVSLLLSTVVLCRAASSPIAGGAGYASYFTRTKPNTVGLLWNDIPTDAITFEYWIRVTDPHVTFMQFLSYSCCASLGRSATHIFVRRTPIASSP